MVSIPSSTETETETEYYPSMNYSGEKIKVPIVQPFSGRMHTLTRPETFLSTFGYIF